MDSGERLEWLLAGDPAIAFQARRDLCGIADASVQARIAAEGWGKAILAAATPEAGWGRGYYMPKWTSTHYSLLDLRLLELDQHHPLAQCAVARVLRDNRAPHGGVIDDVCVNGMFLHVSAWFQADAAALERIVDFILARQVSDGGFNCDIRHGPVHHSSMHSTICVLEGFTTYLQQGYAYRRRDIELASRAAQEFLLVHKLFRSHRTGAVIHPSFLVFPTPARYKYNVLRALDHFRASGAPYDSRMDEAVAVVMSRRKRNGLWNAAALMSGEVHVVMEKAGQPGRWPTLQALRVLRHFGIPEDPLPG